jgi:hypothetical protein
VPLHGRQCRTELFIGPLDHNLMGQLYAIRSDIEHLNEHKYLEVFDRAQRPELLQKEAIAEHIARNALAHIIATPPLWAELLSARILFIMGVFCLLSVSCLLRLGR